MVYESPGRCPVCDAGLQIGRLMCPDCETVVEGRFEPCRFCKLGKDHRTFAEVFLRCRGNIREVEKELGISYPTVRNRLEQLLAAMGYDNNGNATPEHASMDSSTDGRDVLDQLDRGEVSVEEALTILKATGRKGKEDGRTWQRRG